MVKWSGAMIHKGVRFNSLYCNVYTCWILLYFTLTFFCNIRIVHPEFQLVASLKSRECKNSSLVETLEKHNRYFLNISSTAIAGKLSFIFWRKRVLSNMLSKQVPKVCSLILNQSLFIQKRFYVIIKVLETQELLVCENKYVFIAEFVTTQ